MQIFIYFTIKFFFTRKTKEDLALLKDREYFEKPSEIRNQAKQAAKLREKRRQERQRHDKNKQF